MRSCDKKELSLKIDRYLIDQPLKEYSRLGKLMY